MGSCRQGGTAEVHLLGGHPDLYGGCSADLSAAWPLLSILKLSESQDAAIFPVWNKDVRVGVMFPTRKEWERSPLFILCRKNKGFLDYNPGGQTTLHLLWLEALQNLPKGSSTPIWLPSAFSGPVHDTTIVLPCLWSHFPWFWLVTCHRPWSKNINWKLQIQTILKLSIACHSQ